MNKVILVIICSLLIVGCVVKPIEVEVQDIGLSEVVSVFDLRSEEEKEYESFMGFFSSDRDGIYRIASDRLNPTQIRIFQHRVYEEFSDPPEVKVHHFVSYMNMQYELKRAKAASILGL